MKESQSIQEKWKFYFDNSFVWSISATEIFYRFSYRAIKKNFYVTYFSCNEDFEDVFQDAMLKFCLIVDKGEKRFFKNQNAFNYFYTIFHHTTIDFFKDRNKISTKIVDKDIYLVLPTNRVRTQEQVAEEIAKDPRLLKGSR